MSTQRSFGRRAAAAAERPRAAPRVRDAEPAPVEAWPAVDPAEPSLEDELREWKKTRKRRIPWRQISLMASLCFGVASFVLPDSVNANVDWLLYALAAASLYAGFARRRESKG